MFGAQSISDVDYSVYLVTDSKLNHPSRSLIQTIEQAIQGGVKIVQLREKELSTDKFIELAEQVHALTKKYNVPLIINDNIDVALSVDAEGVHIGQDDTSYAEARRRLGPSKLIGVSVENSSQAQVAIDDGADYIGIQICYPTDTKTSLNPCLGHIGVRKVLESIHQGVSLKTVAIGGMNEGNTRRLVSLSAGSNGRVLDGVAYVSSIVGAPDAKSATARLLDEVIAGKSRDNRDGMKNLASPEEVLKSVPGLLTTLRQNCPLTHHITNYVAMNDSANCTLAIGGSPIMAPDEVEAADLSKVVSSVVLNIGTLTEPVVKCMLEAGKHANAQSKPVVLDPVGAGATALRRDTTRRILNSIRVDIIKGNCGEISAIADIVGCHVTKAVEMRGVDSIGDGFEDPAKIVQLVAKREDCVVVMTGKLDYISDGVRTVTVENGHTYQGQITGSGCMLTSIVASFAGISPEDHFAAAVAGVLCFNLAGEHAGTRSDVRGPGTFRAALIDEIANLNPDNLLAEFKVKICSV